MSKSNKRGRLALAAVSAGAASVGLVTPAAHAASTVVSVSNDAELSAALTAQTAGEEIEVQPGTYTTTAVSITADNVILKAAGAVTLTKGVTIRGNGDTLDGFTITGATSYGVNVVTGSNATIENNHIDANGNSAIYIKNGITGTQVLHNEASGNVNASKRTAAGVEVHGANTTVAGNILHDNQDSGIEFYDNGAAYPAPNGANSGIAVNNVIWHNGDHGIDNLAVNHGVIANNTVFDNCTTGINLEGGTTSVSNPHLNPGGSYSVYNNVSFDNATDTSCSHGPQGSDKGGQPGQIRVADDQVNSISLDHNLTWIDPARISAAPNGGALYIWSPVVGGVAQPVGYTTLTAFQTAQPTLAVHDLSGDPKLAGEDPTNLPAVDLRPTAVSPMLGQAVPNNTTTQYGLVDAAWTTRLNPSALGAFELGGTPGVPPSAALPPVTVVPPPGGGTPPPTGGPVTPAPTVNQLGGNDRYTTGLLVSQHRWQNGQANAVVLATGRNFADALAGVPLAAKAGGPLLLVDGTSGTMDPTVAAEINRVLKPGGVAGY